LKIIHFARCVQPHEIQNLAVEFISTRNVPTTIELQTSGFNWQQTCELPVKGHGVILLDLTPQTVFSATRNADDWLKNLADELMDFLTGQLHGRLEEKS
jgi:hypothetical protein